MRLAAALLAVATLSGASSTARVAGQTTSTPRTVIENVAVVELEPPRVVANRTVVLAGDTIERVDAAGAPLPASARRIDGRGKFLMPALADMHVHISSPRELGWYVAAGVTLVRNMNGSPQHLAWRDQIRRGTLLGPDLYTTSPTFYSDPADAASTVAAYKKAGYDALKVYHFMSSDGYRAVLTAGKLHGMRVVGHQPTRTTAFQAAKMGIETLEHLLGFGMQLERQPSALRERLKQGRYSFRYTYAGVDIDEALLPEIATQLQHTGVRVTPTLVALDRWMPWAEGQAIVSRPRLKLLPDVIARWRGWNEAEYTADWTKETHVKGKQARRTIVRHLHRARVPLLLGTDAGAYLVEPGVAVHDELSALTEAGLTPAEALRTATIEPARYLELEHQWGTIRRGARADLLLLARNPLERVAHAREPLAVVVRGHWLDATALATLW